MKSILAALFVASAAAHGATFVVTNADDSGTGSLRWAIEQANATPGADIIQARLTGIPTIVLESPLPPISERVTIDAYCIVDGSHLAAADGIVITGDIVQVKDLTVQNFNGDGIVVRGDIDWVYFTTSAHNRNGIRVEGRHADIRGDRFMQNSEAGVWVTASSTGNQIGLRVPDCHILCAPEPSNNQISGNGGNGMRIDGTYNTIDWAWVGTNGPNGGDGIVVNGEHNVIINSVLSNNRGRGAFLAVPARFENNSGDCNAGSFLAGNVIEPPTILFARSDPTVTVLNGEFHGVPNAQYTIWIHDAMPSCPANDTSIGSVTATTDATGFVAWTALFERKPLKAVTAIAAKVEGEETSRRGDLIATFVSGESRVDLAVRTTAPAAAVTSNLIEFETTVTNNGPAAVGTVIVEIPHTAGTTYDSATISNGTCYLSGLQDCFIGPLAAGDHVTIRERLRVTAASGTLLQHVASARLSPGTPLTDVDATNNSAALSVPVVKLARNRPVKH
jgi:hypothetical protein